ncbi:MAG: hypothetical protein JWO11_1357 [Nocardioides sp.]|nr:hypothetical protein [Nocardioides sp.]
MRVQHQRSDVLPLTWEVPAAVLLAWLLTAVLALPFGQGLAYVVTGGSFVWPTDLVASLSGLFGGTPGLGVDVAPPTRGLVYACVAATELAAATLAVAGLIWWWRTAGPGAQYGLANRTEARHVLGPGALSKRASTIRPDLLLRGGHKR